VIFFVKLETIIEKFGIDGSIRGIISVNDANVTIHFHLLRSNEIWLANDLEVYKEESIAEFEFSRNLSKFG